jgi:hypothetical protein
MEFQIACRRGRDLPWRRNATLVTHKQIAILTTAFWWFQMAMLRSGMSTYSAKVASPDERLGHTYEEEPREKRRKRRGM